MLSNYGAEEDSWESLGQQRDQTIQSWKSTLNIHWKDWYWSSNTLSTWCEELTHWQRPWCWERLKAKEKRVAEDDMVRWQHWLNGHETEQSPDIVEDRETWCAVVHGVAELNKTLQLTLKQYHRENSKKKPTNKKCYLGKGIGWVLQMKKEQ